MWRSKFARAPLGRTMGFGRPVEPEECRTRTGWCSEVEKGEVKG
jgi:hypothetical protein